jgi:hypothetical protein
MTSPDVLRVKAIAALLEAADLDDDDDAKVVLGLIRNLVASSSARASDKPLSS